MLYKFIDETRVLKCRMNGIVNGRAISNLPRYLEIHPQLAEKEGYKPLISDDIPAYNVDTQYVSAYYEDGAAITRHWKIENITGDGE